jgi:hypothetical protein
MSGKITRRKKIEELNQRRRQQPATVYEPIARIKWCTRDQPSSTEFEGLFTPELIRNARSILRRMEKEMDAAGIPLELKLYFSAEFCHHITGQFLELDYDQRVLDGILNLGT